MQSKIKDFRGANFLPEYFNDKYLNGMIRR